MLESGRWWLFKGLAATICIVAVTWLALDYFIPAPPSEFSIATGFKGGSAEFIGNRYKDRLARQKMKVEVLLTDGSGADFQLLQNPKSGVKVAVIQGGVSSSKQMPGLLSLGRINYQVFWIFYRSTETLDDLTQLKGKRISVGPEGSGTRTVAIKLLAASGVNSENAKLSPLAGERAAEALKGGSLDVMFLANTSDAPLYKSLLGDPDIRVMNLRRAEALTRIYPFLVRLVLPEGVVDFVRNIPATDLTVVATTNAIIVREDVHPAIVGLLAEAMFDEHSGAGVFENAGTFPSQFDPEFPMAQSARDFYKNGPSLLSRFVPFWMTNYVQRIIALLVTVIAIVLPAFNYAPKLYLWYVRERLSKLYGRLRVIEKELNNRELDVSHLEKLLNELDRLDEASSIRGIPIRQSDMFFQFKEHLNLIRTRLASHLADAQKRREGASAPATTLVR